MYYPTTIPGKALKFAIILASLWTGFYFFSGWYEARVMQDFHDETGGFYSTQAKRERAELHERAQEIRDRILVDMVDH
ncbi:hypothetical protein LF1_14560 [Rubripirellula obstinata]|uniref:Uncharacterized protein n=1 Tax=Rubripirellula obstinata TaxID=406547 RepID=A0A5B1CFF8_9BACT|nr:hypothetical protein [Rubripirellula obstinata]KAA1258932.1 hypothetical protein LF1_14560 [Rubripirellula obstinata]